jgi:hypothetical protein
MVKEPEKSAKVFIALISIAGIAAVLAGSYLVYHRQAYEADNGLWEQVTPLANDDDIPVFLSSPYTAISITTTLFSPGPPGT